MMHKNINLEYWNTTEIKFPKSFIYKWYNEYDNK